MNKQLHRVIFNAARGVRMAVHEAASSNSGRGRLKATAVAAFVAMALHGQFSLAQIAGDPSAPANQRAVVVTAPNGTPLVNIQTPSAGGVSRNTYRQFDVNGQGAILNNSRTQVQTQLGGWVQGNPYLAAGGARIILNEVNSANPSQLRGYVEVAGQRAEVIIANPAGIQVNGGGFINASRATLTTGTPKFNDTGSLESFLVRGGTVSIEGAGLDASKTDYAAILARAVQVNAGIWASELKVVAGVNEISADATSSSATPLAGGGPVPTFALDVAQLGGMYAGKITLIGTESGVGVRNAGDIGAGAGGLVVTADGRLENSGTLRGHRVQARSNGANVENSGTIEARSIELASAADVINKGTIRQTGANTLTVQAPSLSNTQGGFIGAEPVAAPSATDTGQGGGQASGTGAQPAPSGGGTVGAAQGDTAQGASDSGSGVTAVQQPIEAPIVPGRITAAGSVRNDGGRIYAGDVNLQTPNIDNSGGSLNVNELAVSGPRFSNAGGTLNVRNHFTAQVGSFDNAGGKIGAGQIDVTAASGDLDNRRGTIRSEGDTNLRVAGTLVNEGSVTSGGNTRIQAGSVQSGSKGILGAGVKNDGTLGPQGTLDVAAEQDLQAHGVQLAAGAMHLRGANIDVSGSTTSAASISATASAGNIDTSGAKVVATEMLHLQANSQASQALVNTNGAINAGRLDLQVANISNTEGGEIAQVGTQPLQLAVSGVVDNSGGRIVSNGDLAIDAASVRSRGGQIRAAADAQGAGGNLSVSSAGALDNSQGGKLVADSKLTLASAGLDNTDGQASGKQVDVDTRGRLLANVRGTLASTDGQLKLQSGELDNSAGFVGAQGDLQMTTGAVANGEGGTIGSNGALRIDTQGRAFDNRGGKTQARGDLQIDAGTIDNSGALIRSAGTATLNATSLANRNNQGADQGIEATDIAIRSNSIDNANGAVRAARDATLTSGGRIDNSAGLISAQRDLSVVDPQAAGTDPAGKTLDIVNTGGTLVANQDLRIDAACLSSDGTTTAGRDLGIALTQDVVNNVDVSAGRNLSYTTAGHFTNNAKLSAGEQLTVEGRTGIDNNASGELSGADTVVRTQGTLNNKGLIDSAGHTHIEAGTLSNTARIYGDRISVAAGTLNNGSESPDDSTVKAGVIASRTSDIDLGVGQLNNSDGAEISHEPDSFHCYLPAGFAPTMKPLREIVIAIQGNGALIAGNSVDLKVKGNLANTDGATIAGRTALKIDAGISGDGLYIGGALDEDGLATGRAQKVRVAV